jgi:hypothetical protein
MKHINKGKYIVPRVIGWIFMLPLVSTVAFAAYSAVSASITEHNSLAYNVSMGNYERAEKLLKRGVSPDCTADSNKKAADGEQTLLALLCENGGFWDYSGYAVDYEVTDEELAMAKLLIEYGADTEHRTYKHEYDSSQHELVNAADIYQSSDKCGYTPLLYAVRYGHIEYVKLLVESGADVNAADYCGFTPVLTVSDNFDDDDGLEMLEYLLQSGGKTTGVTRFYQDGEFLAQRHRAGSDPWENEKIEELLK